MARTHVVILSKRSLFMEGVASRLRQDEARVEVVTMDAHAPQVLAQVIAARPAAVILDATDPDATQGCTLSTLLQALPALKVIHLDLQRKQVRIVTSEQRPAGEVRDLLEIIAPSATT